MEIITKYGMLGFKMLQPRDLMHMDYTMIIQMDLIYMELLLHGLR